jgi:hypothetical protein
MFRLATRNGASSLEKGGYSGARARPNGRHSEVAAKVDALQLSLPFADATRVKTRDGR